MLVIKLLRNTIFVCFVVVAIITSTIAGGVHVIYIDWNNYFRDRFASKRSEEADEHETNHY